MAFLSPPPPPPPAPPSNFSSQPPPPSRPPILPSRRRPAAVPIPNPGRLPRRRHTIPSVDVVGQNKLPQPIIQEHLLSLEGTTPTRQQIFDRLSLVNAWYLDNGYVCSRCFVLQIPGWFKRTLVFYCVEPVLVSLKRIPVDKDGNRLEGASVRTTQNTIVRAASLSIGEVFRWDPSQFASLMATSIFEYADAKVNVINDRHVELLLYLRERPSGRIEPGAGITSDGRVYGDISIVDNNFLGRAQRLRLEWQKRVDLGRAAGGFVFEDMRVGAHLPLSFRFRAYRDSNSARAIPTTSIARQAERMAGESQGFSANVSSGEDELRYEKDRDGLMFDLGYRPKRSHALFNVSPIFEVIHPSLSDHSGAVSSAQMAIQISATHATRLPVDLPRFGHLARIDQMIGSCLSNPKEAFHRTTFKVSEYLPFAKYASLALGGTIGMGSTNLPWHELKSLGGPHSVRGYQYGEIGRHRAYGHARVEVRVPLTRLPSDSEPEREQAEKSPEKETTSKKKSRRKKKKSEPVKETSDVIAPKQEMNYRGNMMPAKIFDKLPPLVGVLFGDVATSSVSDRDLLGASYGVGLRIGGVIALHCCQTMDDSRPRVHFGLIDRSL